MYLVLLLTIIASTHATIPIEMRDLIDPYVHPCKDFYRYACGSWLIDNQLPPQDVRITYPTTVITTRIETVMNDMITKQTPIVYELWESCRALKEITDLHTWPLQKDIQRIYKVDKRSELMELAGEFVPTRGGSFLQIQIGPDPLNSKRITFLLHPELTLPHKKYYSDPVILKEYRLYINKVMKMAGYSITKSKFKRKRKQNSNQDYSKTIIEIEQKLIEYHNQVGNTIQPISIQKAITAWPTVFQHYIKGMGFNYVNKDFIIYASSQYLEKLENMVQTIDLDKLRDYIEFRMIHSRVPWLGHNFDKVWYILFRKTIKRQRLHRSREQICRDRIREYLPDLIGQEFYKKTFDTKQKQIVLEIFQLIQDTMRNHINRSTWLDEKNEKKKAQNKLNRIRTLIGQSKHVRSYPSSLSRTEYAKNMYTLLSHSFAHEMHKVGHDQNSEEWISMSSIELNARYLPHQNLILLPAALLQSPLMHKEHVDPARNFGAIGAIIGHELIHAFDADGSRYDEHGNQNPWWDPRNSIYTQGAKCFEKQYSALQVKGIHVDGQLTRNENIADNGGLALAWDAYRKYIANVNPDIHGANQKQRDRIFFLAFGQALCEKARDNIMFENVRAPGQLRVNGVIMNNPNFAKTFECGQTAPMNPLDKCFLW